MSQITMRASNSTKTEAELEATHTALREQGRRILERAGRKNEAELTEMSGWWPWK